MHIEWNSEMQERLLVSYYMLSLFIFFISIIFIIYGTYIYYSTGEKGSINNVQWIIVFVGISLTVMGPILLSHGYKSEHFARFSFQGYYAFKNTMSIIFATYLLSGVILLHKIIVELVFDVKLGNFMLWISNIFLLFLLCFVLTIRDAFISKR